MTSSDSKTALPSTAFSTSVVDTRDSFDSWRQVMDPLFQMEPGKQSHDFKGIFEAWHLGSLVAGTHQSETVRFGRDTKSLANGVDHYVIQLYTGGGFTARMGDHEVEVKAGDVTLMDLGRPIDGLAMASQAITVVVPRDLMEQQLQGVGDLHGLVLSGQSTMGGLLGDYLRALVHRLPAMSVAEAPHAARATLDLAVACFQPTAESLARARPVTAQAALTRIKAHIHAHAKSAGLSPESICASFRLSRTQLYRLFEPLGGVSRYIQHCRLNGALQCLADPLRRVQGIAQIAYEWGFTSEAHFSRAFRARFGLTPTDARTMGPDLLLRLGGAQGEADDDSTLGTWITRLSPR